MFKRKWEFYLISEDIEEETNIKTVLTGWLWVVIERDENKFIGREVTQSNKTFNDREIKVISWDLPIERGVLQNDVWEDIAITIIVKVIKFSIDIGERKIVIEVVT